jgi:hypothetical protein
VLRGGAQRAIIVANDENADRAARPAFAYGAYLTAQLALRAVDRPQSELEPAPFLGDVPPRHPSRRIDHEIAQPFRRADRQIDAAEQLAHAGIRREDAPVGRNDDRRHDTARLEDREIEVGGRPDDL